MGQHVATLRLVARPAHQFGQLVLRGGESLVLAALGLDFVQDQAGDRILLGLGQPGQFGKGFLKSGVHGEASEGVR